MRLQQIPSLLNEGIFNLSSRFCVLMFIICFYCTIPPRKIKFFFAYLKILLAKKKKCGINRRVERQSDCSSAW